MSIYFGDFKLNDTVRIDFNTSDPSGNSVTYSSGEILLFKDSSETPKPTSSGVNSFKDFAGVSGAHLLEIDTSDTVDTNYFEQNSFYNVMLSGAQIEDMNINAWVGNFSIESRGIYSAPVDDKTALDALHIMSSILAGKLNGSRTGTEVFRSLDDTEDRVTVTVDINGNRTDIQYNI